MLAKDFIYEWESFKHEFKRRKGYYGISFMNGIHGAQNFKFNVTGGTETFVVANGDHDKNALSLTTCSKEFHIRFLEGTVGHSTDKYHWLEYAIRTGRFTHHSEQDMKMKKAIIALLNRFNIPYETYSSFGNTLICHSKLYCHSCKGSGVRAVRLTKTDVKRSIDSTCDYCDGMAMDININIQSLPGWGEFND